MPTLNLTEQQVSELVKQLPPEQRREVLMSLATEASAKRDERMLRAEAQLRKVAAGRGLNWDKMSEQEREALVDNLVHEDRRCA